MNTMQWVQLTYHLLNWYEVGESIFQLKTLYLIIYVLIFVSLTYNLLNRLQIGHQNSSDSSIGILKDTF